MARPARCACKTPCPGSPSRLISTCRVGGTDLNAWLVEEGWALACKGCFGGFPLEQGRARLARRGLWSGRFEGRFRIGTGKQFIQKGVRKTGGLCVEPWEISFRPIMPARTRNF
jgi:hypothetical protein